MSEENKMIYKGMTNDLDRRLREHEQGRSKSTRNFLPVKLIHVEVCSDRRNARELEKFYKSGYRREVINEILTELD